MAKGNPLQQQLLKAGLVKKSKVSEVARQQQKAREGKAPPTDREIQLEAERARQEKAGRDRALEAERRARARTIELRAQARQIIADKKVAPRGDSEYRFSADGAIRTLLVDEELRKQLSSGALVIASVDGRYELLPRAAAEKVRERDAGMIVVDHGEAADGTSASGADDDEYYARFKVPDDLVW